MFKPMKPPSGVLEDHDLARLRFPLYGSYKLDGIRASVQDGVLLSSTLTPIPNRELQAMWGRPEFNNLDGEIVVGEPFGEGVFNRTTSLVMSGSKRADNAVLYVFDKYDPRLDYEHRLLAAAEQIIATPASITDCPIALHGFKKLHNLAELEAFEDECLTEQYEGMMLRKPTGLYKQGRSSLADQGLLRRKPFADAEAIVIGTYEEHENTNAQVVNGLGRSKRGSSAAGKVAKGTLGGFRVKGLTAFEGVEFSIGSFGGDQVAANHWAVRDELVGKILKFKFQRYGSMSKPRQAIALGFRDARDLEIPGRKPPVRAGAKLNA